MFNVLIFTNLAVFSLLNKAMILHDWGVTPEDNTCNIKVCRLRGEPWDL